jgi:hypothetical protein
MIGTRVTGLRESCGFGLAFAGTVCYSTAPLAGKHRSFADHTRDDIIVPLRPWRNW